VRILQVIPFFAVGVFFFIVDFLLIDKSDEYQLIFFITRFKSIGFFLSYGLIKLIIQYIQYYRCVVFGTDDSLTCATSGPAAGL
jgi:hypothetical protein